MARSSVTTQKLPLAGLLPVYTAAVAAGEIADVGNCWLAVINGGGASITVTVNTPGTIDGDLAIADRVVTVPVGTTPTLIPLNSPNYRQTSASAAAPADIGRAYVDYSAVTSVTRAVVSL